MPCQFRLPPLKARDPDEPHRAATQLELFFDLISVIAIAAVTAGLHHAISEGDGLEKLPAFAFLFTAIWWAWMNFTWFASAFDNDGPIYRVLVMAIMAGELIFAGGAGEMFETLDFSWGVAGWCIMRVAMALLWLRASANAEYRTTTLRYAVGILFAQACWVAYYFSVTPGSELFYALGILIFFIEFSVPPFAERARTTPFHRHHIIERYGLLTIISLGEIMLAISLGFGMLYGKHPEIEPVVTAASASIIVFSIFWIYFCEPEHLPKREFMTAFIWGYGHVFIFGALAALGAGIAAELDLSAHHSHTTQAEIAWWLGTPLAMFFLMMWVTRDRHFDLGKRAYALPAMAVISFIVAWAGLPCWAFSLVALIALVWRVPIEEPVDEAP
jgi:low temperature requirement protein LtrA